MKVYVVTTEQYFANHFSFDGVFSSREKAERWVAEAYGAVHAYTSARIYEAEIDAELAELEARKRPKPSAFPPEHRV